MPTLATKEKGTQTMNMITTNDAFKLASDELVPSRYALKVGEIDVLVISDGVVTPPAESMATNADPAVRAAWLDDMFLSHDAFDWALNAVVACSGVQNHTHRHWLRGGGSGLPAVPAFHPSTGGRRHRSRVGDRRGADSHAL